MGRIKTPATFFWRGFGELHTSDSYQAKFKRPFDSPPAAIDIEFAVNALGMGTNRTQSDDKFLSDLGARQLGFEQAEDVQFTLTERFDQGR